METGVVNQHYAFNREMVVQAFSQRGKNVNDFFHSMLLTPAQMMTFFTSQPTVGKLLQLRKALHDLGDDRDVFDFVIPVESKKKE